MIDTGAFKRMSYGLYVVCSGNQKKGNGYISNSVFQVTASPAQIAACCHKNNHTAGIIKETGSYSISVLHNEADTAIIDKFGYKSGADIDKLKGMNVEYGGTGIPILLNEAIAWIECKVVKTIDVGTHLIFIGEVLQTGLLEEAKQAMTYAEFKEKKHRTAPANAPTHIDEPESSETKETGDKYECQQCGFVYENEEQGTPFEELPDDWTCPVCGAPKSKFKTI